MAMVNLAGGIAGIDELFFGGGAMGKAEGARLGGGTATIEAFFWGGGVVIMAGGGRLGGVGLGGGILGGVSTDEFFLVFFILT